MTKPTIDQLAIISYEDGTWKYGYVKEIYKQGYVLKREDGGRTLREYILEVESQENRISKSTVDILLLTDEDNNPSLIRRDMLGRKTFKGLV